MDEHDVFEATTLPHKHAPSPDLLFAVTLPDPTSSVEHAARDIALLLARWHRHGVEAPLPQRRDGVTEGGVAHARRVAFGYDRTAPPTVR